MNIYIRQQSYMVGLGVWKTRGQQNKRGDPLFFFVPPLAGGCENKRGVRKERGVHAPRAFAYFFPSPCGCRQPFVIHSISNLKNPTIPILNVKNPTILISNLKNPTISISTVKNPTISEPVLELYLLNLDLIFTLTV